MLKKISGKFLKKISEKVVISGTTSFCSCGVEKMPESIKRLR